MSSDPFHHVRDFPHFELWGGKTLPLPHFDIPGYGTFQVTKYMILQAVAAALTLIVFNGLARHLRSGKPTKGTFWNFWEAIALFIRDEVVRPTIGDGHHDDHGHDDHGHGGHGHHGHGGPAHAHHADQFLPYIWSCFFFILFCNLLGAVPLLGSPTASISLTVVLAVVTFAHNVWQGSKQFGVVGFWRNQCPPLGLSGAMNVIIGTGLWCIEVLGLFIKHGVLAIRLFANIMGGHTALGVILGFIVMPEVASSNWQFLIAPASIGGQIFIGMLELFVAFLQAYVFAYLSTIFLSSCTHAH